MATKRKVGGRPCKEIDGETVYALARLGCSVPEIAAVCKCSEDTLSRRYADKIAKGREAMKTRLRRLLLRAAERGSAAVLIFLAKSVLNLQEQAAPPVSVEFIVHEATSAIPCSCIEDSRGAKADCSICHGAGTLPTQVANA